MSRQRLAALSTIIAVLAPAEAAAIDLKFHSREYKLMLEPGKFDVKQPGSAVGEFWEEKLTKILAEQLDKRKDGTSRHRGRLELSFKYDSGKGTVSDEVARRALRLFTGLQAGLGDWVSRQRDTKASIALPTDCH
jgi:hypothetical protein